MEVDEAKVGRRKYNRGWIIGEQWVFSAIECNNKSFLLLITLLILLTLNLIYIHKILNGCDVICVLLYYFGVWEEHYEHYLTEFMFKKRYDFNDRMPQFLN